MTWRAVGVGRVRTETNAELQPDPARSTWRAFFSYDESRLFTHYLPLVFLVMLVGYWLNAFVPLAIDQHHNYFTSDFDLGIFDQATWLLAHGRGFITVRGLPFL